MRISVVNWRTLDADVFATVQAISRVLKQGVVSLASPAIFERPLGEKMAADRLCSNDA